MAKKSRKQAPLDRTLPIYQVKIALQHIKPPIWRRVQTNDCSLDELHDIIQVCMGWEGEHMHAFVIEGEEFGNPRRGSQAEYDSRFVRLSEVVEEGHTRFRYDYDLVATPVARPRMLPSLSGLTRLRGICVNWGAKKRGPV